MVERRWDEVGSVRNDWNSGSETGQNAPRAGLVDSLGYLKTDGIDTNKKSQCGGSGVYVEGAKGVALVLDRVGCEGVDGNLEVRTLWRISASAGAKNEAAEG